MSSGQSLQGESDAGVAQMILAPMLGNGNRSVFKTEDPGSSPGWGIVTLDS